MLLEIWEEVRPSKDKKDATSYPPSEEMKKDTEGKQRSFCT